MNIIQIVSDTFRRDYLGCYGNDWIHTDHLDAFARDSLVFDKAYIASFPTIPHRRDLFTGRYTFAYSTWAQLPKDEVILSQLLRQAGYTTMLIADTYHLFRDGHFYDRGFDAWWWIRGQESDRYATRPPKEPVESHRHLTVNPQYVRNVSNRETENDYFVAQTMTAATKWLELNYDQHKGFFLHVDAFDPHEPWDPPRWYFNRYAERRDMRVPKCVYMAKGRTAADLTEDELSCLRALYAGEVTLVDRWVGTLLQKIEDLGLLENTAVIFTSDHGTYIGEHGYVHKMYHLYEEVAHIPLIVRMPDKVGSTHRRCEALVQPPDLMPTILELVDAEIPETVQGRSILPLIRGREDDVHDIAVSSKTLLDDPGFLGVTHHMTVTSEDWALLMVRKGAPKTDNYGFKIEPELYHLPSDPKQTRNLFSDRKDVARELHSKVIQFLESLGTSEDLLRGWR